MQHTIFGLTALYIAAIALWVVKEIKEMKDCGLLSDWSYE